MSKTTAGDTSGKDIVLLYCQHCIAGDAESGLNILARSKGKVRAVIMPCSSKVQVPHLLQLLAEGHAGVEVVACLEEACSFLVGSSKTEKRIAYARGLLASAGLEPERLGITRGKDLSADDLTGFAAQRAEAIANGPAADNEGDTT
jgi:coenzyme F420-reducing hydrogenase delta subunit